MSDFEYLSKSSLSSYGEVYEKDVKEITDMMKCFTPYMFEPEDENDSESKTNLERSSRVGNLE